MAYVRRETGYWKHCMLRQYPNVQYEGYSCSVCHTGFKAGEFNLARFKFCPECGSKMIEVRGR